MRKVIESTVVVLVVVLLSCQWGCASQAKTVTLAAPTAQDQEATNQRAKEATADAWQMYKDRVRARLCQP